MASPNHTMFPQLELFVEYSPITSGREVWLPVVGWEELYEVSNRGRVRSRDRLLTFPRRRRGRMESLTVLRKGRMLVCHSQMTGYLAVNLSREHHMRRCVIHRLVMIAFAGPE